MKLPLFVTIPHSGEMVPEFCDWLHGLPEEILMCDLDRYVDRLYEPSLMELEIPWIKTQWHRYAADLNRIPSDVDASSVVGNQTKAGTHPKGFHWVMTTTSVPLMKAPISQELHQKLIDLIYKPFHESVHQQFENFENQGHRNIFHMDVHSMPSVGTKLHRDPGEKRTDIVISDSNGRTGRKEFIDLVIAAYAKAGFKVGYNWPYGAGRVSEQYGKPAQGHHAVQVELNRSLYMDEVTKKIKDADSKEVTVKLQKALIYIHQNLSKLL